MSLRANIVLSCLSLGAAALTADAAVVFSGNGKMLFAGVEAAYAAASGTDSSGPVGTGASLFNPPEEMSATAAGGVSGFTPTSTFNPASDYITGSASLTYAYGEGLSADALTFEVQSGLHVGAQSARNSAGDEASGVFSAFARALFFVDDDFGPDPTPYGTVIGALDFGAIADVGPYAQLLVTVAVDGLDTLLFTSGTGFSGASVDLITGKSYEISFQYKMIVPYGTVAGAGILPPPAFSYGVSVVPGPSGLALVGAAGIAARRRRR